MKLILLATAFLLSFLAPLSAHPVGHDGGFVETVVHFVTHPFHLLLWGVVLTVGILLGRRSLRSSKKDLAK